MNLTKNKISKLKKKKNQSRKKFNYNKKYKHHNTYKKKKHGHIKNNTLKQLKGGMMERTKIKPLVNETMKSNFETSKIMCGNKTGLNRIFNKYGYYLGEVPGDGDCMYSAFKLALKDQPLVKDLTIKAIRQRVADYILSVYNGKEKSNFITKDDVEAAIIADMSIKYPNNNINLSIMSETEKQNVLDVYINSINTPGNYGDHLVFSILQNKIFDVSVTVYQCSQNRKVNNKIERTVVNYEYNGSNKKKGHIILYLQDNNDSSAHYDPVLKLSTGTKMGPVDIGRETQPVKPSVATKPSIKPSIKPVVATAVDSEQPVKPAVATKPSIKPAVATSLASEQPVKPSVATSLAKEGVKLTRPPNLLKPPKPPKPPKPNTTNTNIQVNQSTVGPVKIGPQPKSIDTSRNKELKIGELVYYNENVSNSDHRKYITAKIEKINKEKDITTYNLIYIDRKNRIRKVNNVNLTNIQQKIDNQVSGVEPLATQVEQTSSIPLATQVEQTSSIPLATQVEQTSSVPLATQVEQTSSVPLATQLEQTSSVPLATQLEQTSTLEASAPPPAQQIEQTSTVETSEQGKIKIITRATPIDDNLKRIDISIIAPNNVETIVKDYSKDNATQALNHL